MKSKEKKPIKSKSVLNSQEEDQFEAAEEKWQEEYEDQVKYDLELMTKGAALERKRILSSLRKFLDQEEKENIKPIENQVLLDEVHYEELKMSNDFNIEELVNCIETMKFFDPKYKPKVLSWFKGLIPRNPIPLNVSADIFVSLIADMIDNEQKIIRNSKRYITSFIEMSFRFNGKKCKEGTIYQIMKPYGENPNRVSHKSQRIPNIKDFIK